MVLNSLKRDPELVVSMVLDLRRVVELVLILEGLALVISEGL
jgi:hypothetical protein